MKQRVLVTGAAGFMGSHLSESLANDGFEVYGIDNLSIGRDFNIPSNIKFIKCDLVDDKATKKVIENVKPELIYHLAAWAHEGLSQFMPKLITENNYNAFLNLIVPALNNGMKRIVVASSMSVYGAQEPPFNEDMPTKPDDVYAVAKAAMEKTVEILADVHGFDYTIIRPHNVYGPKQALWDPYRNVVAIFINRVMRGKAPIIYGDGKQTRAFSYIADVNPYIMKSGLVDQTKGQIINVGPLEEYTINALAETVLKVFKSDLTPIHMPDRPREVKHAYCTNTKVKELLDYKTTTTLEEGVRQMVEWAKELGPQDFQFLDDLELTGHNIPTTWSEKSM
jgi:UDP-glucose 4-epimerase